MHTLRSEAIEAGDPREVTRAITPGLLRMTLLASALSVVLALALFVDAPAPALERDHRLRRLAAARERRLLAARRARRSGPHPPGPDPRAPGRDARRRRAPAPGAAYYRGLAFDSFDGRSWSITPAGPLAGRRQRRGGRELRARARPREPGAADRARAGRQRRPLRRRASRASSRAPCAASSATRSGGLYAVGPGARADPLHDRDRAALLARRGPREGRTPRPRRASPSAISSSRSSRLK